MAFHAKYPLRRSSISEVFDLLLAIPAFEAARAEGLVACEDGQVLDLVTTSTTAIRAVVAYQGTVAEKEEVCVGVEKGAAGVASEAVDVPTIAGFEEC